MLLPIIWFSVNCVKEDLNSTSLTLITGWSNQGAQYRLLASCHFREYIVL